MRSALLLCVALGAVAGAAPVQPVGPRDIPRLIDALGSEDFAEREAATKRLDELNLLALAGLRAATRSENPEVADRAKDLVKRIERRAANDRLLAPTTVELDATDAPLDTVLAALSKQAGCEVVVGGPRANDTAGAKVTVATGKVPFWVAVQKVCAAGRLRVASAGGFVAPGAMPYNVRPGKLPDGTPVRTARNPNNTVVLEAHDGKPFPASVHGAVMVEALELPKGTESRAVAATVLQVWPEPKLSWQSNADVKVTHAADAEKRKVIPDFTPAAVPQVQRLRGGGVVVVRNPDGSITVVNPNAQNPLEVGPNFTPNARQSLVKLKTNASSASELTGSVYGLTRSGVEALAAAALDGDKTATGRGVSGVALTATPRTDAKGKRFVDVSTAYEPLRVQPARVSDELPGAKLNAAGSNSSVLGVRVTDADGNVFDLALPSQQSGFDPSGRQIIARLTLELLDGKGSPRAPATVTFWGTYTRLVEVPFVLKDVPLAGGSK
ncbi:hypothetical protein R5W24_001316 [Gemmata sp. JC717]|uniref:hypothetical protein n=1 Tax=Gemmata algarum TaxID=2975278 RepID=UPI0021BB22A2|nr:hypothetical protein [Gemmata algarum]MDY3552236.1 hypothetical protein [Gemmata algarum]